jgi:tRNA modification GTPase
VVVYLFDAVTSVSNLGIVLKEIEKIKNKNPQKPLIIIANKIDKLDDIQLAELNTHIQEVILLSAKSGFGLEVLTDRLLGLINTGALRNNDTIVTNSRH